MTGEQPGIITDVYVPDEGDWMSDEERQSLTPEIVIDRVRALKPLIAAHALEAERKGRPTDIVLKAIRRSGFFYLTQTRMFGGLEASFDEMFDATNAICEADTATGWLCCFAVTNPRSASGYPLDLLRRLYKDNRYFTLTSAVAPVGNAVKVDGGYRVSGHFAWCTTIQMAEWLSVVAMLDTPDGPRDWSFMMPASSCTILDTWNATGLIATGTHQIVVDDVFVPEDMATAHSVVSPGWHANARKNFSHYPFYIAPVGPGLTTTIAIAVVGMARSVIEHATARMTHHYKRGHTNLDSDKAHAQIRLAQAESMVHGAELMVRDGAREIMAMSCLPPEDQLTGFQQSVGRLAAAAQICRDAAHMLAQSAGTSMYYEESPLGRAYRDLQVGSSHIALDFDTLLESYGRTMVGLPPLQRALPSDSPRPHELVATGKDPLGIYNNAGS